MNSYGSSKLLVVLASIICSNTAAPLQSHLVQFYPISQDQYDSILQTTAGRPVISEGRLITSGLRMLNELRSSISNDINTGWRQILNITGFLPTTAKDDIEKVDGYPLCVIKTNDLNSSDEENDENSAEDGALIQAREENEENDNGRPLISCIVVVKPNESVKQKDYVPQPQPIQNTQNLQTHVPSYYYPPYIAPYNAYPAYYPFPNYPYFGEVRQNGVPKTVKKPVFSMHRKSATMMRSGSAKDIKAEPYSYGGNYYQQDYPHGSYDGAYNNNPYNYYARDSSDESAEEKNFSGEFAGEIGDEDF